VTHLDIVQIVSESDSTVRSYYLKFVQMQINVFINSKALDFIISVCSCNTNYNIEQKIKQITFVLVLLILLTSEIVPDMIIKAVLENLTYYFQEVMLFKYLNETNICKKGFVTAGNLKYIWKI
jgi:hypothetical protein